MSPIFLLARNWPGTPPFTSLTCSTQKMCAIRETSNILQQSVSFSKKQTLIYFLVDTAKNAIFWIFMVVSVHSVKNISCIPSKGHKTKHETKHFPLVFCCQQENSKNLSELRWNKNVVLLIQLFFYILSI